MRVFLFVLGEQQRAGGPRLVSLKTKVQKTVQTFKNKFVWYVVYSSAE